MRSLTNEERTLLFDDLIEYYRFCKKDRRNHIFNAINAIKKDRRHGRIDAIHAAKNCLQRERASYSHLCRMKEVVELLKLNLKNLTTVDERMDVGRTLIDRCFDQARQESLHWSLLGKKVNEYKDFNPGTFPEEYYKLLEKLQNADIKHLKALQKLELANILYGEII